MPPVRKLNAMQERFVQEYLVDYSAAAAAVRAGYSEKTAYSVGPRLLTNVVVQQALTKKLQRVSDLMTFDKAAVANRYWQIATADPRELVEARRECCRHCYGKDHAVQWTDEKELASEWIAWDKRQAKAADPETVGPEPTDAGGFGFNPTLTPHAKCPKCFGEGEFRAVFKDVRNLSPSGLALYAGVKTTKDGVEIKMHDQLAALNACARHVGFFDEDKSGQGGIEQFLRAIMETPAAQQMQPLAPDRAPPAEVFENAATPQPMPEPVREEPEFGPG